MAYEDEFDDVDRESCWFAAAVRYARKVAVENGDDDKNAVKKMLESLIADVRGGNLGAMMPDDDCDCGGMPSL